MSGALRLPWWPREDRAGLPVLTPDELVALRTATRQLISPLPERVAAGAEAIGSLLAGDTDADAAAERLLDYWLYEGVATLAIERAREAGIHVDDWDDVQDDIAEQADQARMVQEAVALQATRMLERAGIPSVVLKGPLMAAEFYGDAALRSPSSDVDLLVAREHLWRAADVMRGAGWAPPEDAIVHGSLPALHLSLEGPGDTPAIELHWRVQYYDEDAHTRGILERRRIDGAVAVPSQQDVLDVLLICWGRDGLHRARLLADIGAAIAGGASLEASHLREVAALRATHASLAPAARALLGLPAAGGGLPARVIRRVGERDRPATTRGAFAQAAVVDLLAAPRGERRARFNEVWLRHPAAIARWHPELGSWRIAAARVASLARTSARAAGLLARRR
ncbi:MAG: nucleotidyltransferase family protein [Solirubrobacteraceae bacterium]|nr:nucleotidyltransferase family protein [Solirubrobacteraceae bacterium]